MLQKGLVVLVEYLDDGSEDERVDVVDFFVYFVGLEKEFYSVQDIGNCLEESDEEDDIGGDRRDEGFEGNNGGVEREGVFDVELDNVDDDGDGDDWQIRKGSYQFFCSLKDLRKVDCLYLY